MAAPNFLNTLVTELESLKQQGLYKKEYGMTSPQQSNIHVDGRTDTVYNFCANNYLGLANHPALVSAAQKALDDYGYGMSSVRFICGTHTIHKDLEKALSDFLGTDDTILYSSCFDANGGLFETLLGPDDAIISDTLNHASIIDGVRLCKAKRFRYANNDMIDLEKQLQAADAAGAKTKLIATDGIFSMDGVLANLPAICDLADQYSALVMVDDSHACGFMGPHGGGTPDYYGLTDRIDIITGTLGKALGGASGGFTAARQPIIDWLRQRSRPYLFSNSLAPMICAASLAALDLVAQEGAAMRERLQHNSQYFRQKMTDAGFHLIPGEHPIIPVMLGDAALATQMATTLLNKHGVYVIGFSYPVVPMGQARIRLQMSAQHTQEQLDHAIDAFIAVGTELSVLDTATL